MLLEDKMGDITVSQATGAFKSVQGKAADQIEPQARRLEKIKKDSAVSFDELRVNLDEAMKQINKAMDQRQVNASISVNKALSQFVIKISDKNTGELLREIPNEAVQKFAMNLEQLKGVLFEAIL